MIDPIWYGETCFILGCGPSLRNINPSSLLGQCVIAINDSFLFAPFADILYFCDLKWWNQNNVSIRERFKGHKIVTLENEIPGVIRMKNTGDSGLETDPGGLRNGSNSGYQAINLAYHLGVKKIVLLGFDMGVVNGEQHWNGRIENSDAGFEMTLKHVMLPKFATLKQPLEKAGIEVVNCTPNSALKVWPYRDLSDELRNETKVS